MGAVQRLPLHGSVLQLCGHERERLERGGMGNPRGRAGPVELAGVLVPSRAHDVLRRGADEGGAEREAPVREADPDRFDRRGPVEAHDVRGKWLGRLLGPIPRARGAAPGRLGERGAGIQERDRVRRRCGRDRPGRDGGIHPPDAVRREQLRGHDTAVDRERVGVRGHRVELRLGRGPLRNGSDVVRGCLLHVARDEREGPVRPEPTIEPSDAPLPRARPLDDGCRCGRGQRHDEPHARPQRVPELGVEQQCDRRRPLRSGRSAARGTLPESPLAHRIDDRVRDVQGGERRDRAARHGDAVADGRCDRRRQRLAHGGPVRTRPQGRQWRRIGRERSNVPRLLRGRVRERGPAIQRRGRRHVGCDVGGRRLGRGQPDVVRRAEPLRDREHDSIHPPAGEPTGPVRGQELGGPHGGALAVRPLPHAVRIAQPPSLVRSHSVRRRRGDRTDAEDKGRNGDGLVPRDALYGSTEAPDRLERGRACGRDANRVPQAADGPGPERHGRRRAAGRAGGVREADRPDPGGHGPRRAHGLRGGVHV